MYARRNGDVTVFAMAAGRFACLLASLVAGGVGEGAFDPRCGRAQELGTCPGYRECLLRLSFVSEEGFLRALSATTAPSQLRES